MNVEKKVRLSIHALTAILNELAALTYEERGCGIAVADPGIASLLHSAEAAITEARIDLLDIASLNELATPPSDIVTMCDLIGEPYPWTAMVAKLDAI
jgi:hypothetical protein